MRYQVSKSYLHSEGWSCTFRQHRAAHSHCHYLHGYAVGVQLTFECTSLDTCNWVTDFGGLHPIKNWLQDLFDHRTLIAQDDPMLEAFQALDRQGLIRLVEVPGVGCEKFAEMIYRKIESEFLPRLAGDREVLLVSVCVSEHGGNSATVLGS